MTYIGRQVCVGMAYIGRQVCLGMAYSGIDGTVQSEVSIN